MKDEFHYVSHYSLSSCLDYMKHSNVYDVFEYNWEEDKGNYLLTLKKVKCQATYITPNMPKPMYAVTFEEVEVGTKINLYRLSSDFMNYSESQLDLFWEKKLEAKKLDDISDNQQELPKWFIFMLIGITLLPQLVFLGVILASVF